MRSVRTFRLLVPIVLALSASSAGSALADSGFTASAAGELTGKALENQVLAVNGGNVECITAETAGTISATESFEQEVEVAYSGCKAFGFVNVHISKAKFSFTANGQLHILEPITITVTKTLFSAHCTVTLPEQTVGTIDYVNKGGKLHVVSTVEGIEYTASGGVCGTSGSNGTFSGTSEVERVGGEWVAFDP